MKKILFSLLTIMITLTSQVQADPFFDQTFPDWVPSGYPEPAEPQARINTRFNFECAMDQIDDFTYVQSEYDVLTATFFGLLEEAYQDGLILMSERDQEELTVVGPRIIMSDIIDAYKTGGAYNIDLKMTYIDLADTKFNTGDPTGAIQDWSSVSQQFVDVQSDISDEMDTAYDQLDWLQGRVDYYEDLIANQ